MLASGCAIALVGWVPPAAQTGTTTTRLDEFVPRYHFREVHTRSVMADAPTVMRAVKSVSADEIALFDLFTRIRRLGRPAPASILNPPRGAPILSVATQTGFLLLADDEHEIVLGTLLAHPGPRPDRADIDAAWFAALSAPGGHQGRHEFPRTAGWHPTLDALHRDAGLRRRRRQCPAIHCLLAHYFSGQLDSARDVTARDRRAGRARADEVD